MALPKKKTTPPKTKAPAAKPRGPGRPRAERKLVKVIAYLDDAVRKRVVTASRAAGFRSVSSWAAQVLEREARSQLRTGEIPRHVMEEIFRDAIPDPTGSIRKAVREERDSGW